MKINSLKIENFRNYESLSLDFSNLRNIIIGENAQGKTNLIEAIYLCAFAKSFRTNSSSELLMFGKELATINANITSEEIDKNIRICINSQGKKMISKDSKLLPRTADLLKNFVVIVFSPEDLRIIKDSPEKRRNFLNTEISQLSPKYCEHLRQYNEALKQKNVLLKELSINNKFDASLLDIFDEQLSMHGYEIIKARRGFISKLSKKANQIQNSISGEKENLNIEIDESLKASSVNDFKNELLAKRNNDIHYGISSIGPHRDDLIFIINGKNAKKFASQGQQRTIALSLKLAEIEIAKEVLDESPVLLLDDVLSELDIERQNYLINEISDIQLFITTTELNEVIKSKITDANIIRIKDGKVVSFK